LVIAVSTAVVPIDSEARRLGGGGSQGMQRSLPARGTPDSVPARPATPNQAAPAAAATGATAAAAAAPKRSWMGPLAGLAAGLGLAALASHLGFGEGLANFMMLALLAIVAVVAIRFLMNRFGSKSAGSRNGMAMAGAGANASAAESPAQKAWQSTAAAGAPMLKQGYTGQAMPSATGVSGSAALPASLPPGFDAREFERIAKLIFIRLQAANDSADLEDLRRFTTPEMFAAARLDLQERAGAAQQTDVVQVDAEVLDVAEEAGRQIASVRFSGLIREEPGAEPSTFDEVWHLAKPSHGDGGWLIAGIQQRG
jgi:predicted lipid-binding transport protein (Tim44 family)